MRNGCRASATHAAQRGGQVHAGVLGLRVASGARARLVLRLEACIVATWRSGSWRFASTRRPMLRNISLLQHGASDLSMPLVLDEHDGASNSSTPIANLENSNAAAAINLENSKKMTSMRLLVAIHNASTVAAETSTGDFGLAETIVNAPSRCTAACIAPPLPRRAIAATSDKIGGCLARLTLARKVVGT